jgi:hypothetical protein
MKKSKSIQAVIRRARAQGRAEAVTIFSSICPEDGLDQYISCSPNGDSGDYSSYWNVDALRKLVGADSEVCDKIDRLAGAHEFVFYLEYDLKKAREALADKVVMSFAEIGAYQLSDEQWLEAIKRARRMMVRTPMSEAADAEFKAIVRSGTEAMVGPEMAQQMFPGAYNKPSSGAHE